MGWANKKLWHESRDKPESFVTVVSRFLPCVAYMQARDRSVVFSFRSQELEPVCESNLYM